VFATLANATSVATHATPPSGIGGFETFVILAAATVIAALVLGAGKAMMNLVRTRQTKRRKDVDEAQAAITHFGQFFFDQPRDERTGTPATIGWTTTVDRRLKEMKASQDAIKHSVNQILYEIKPNGGKNLRGLIENGMSAASTEVERIHKNEESAT